MVLGAFTLKNLTNVILPKLFANELGDVFVPTGTFEVRVTSRLHLHTVFL